MRLGLSKHIITNFLILLFISAKLTGLHAFFHDSEKTADTECSICLHAAQHQDLKIIPEDTPTLNPIFSVIISNEIQSNIPDIFIEDDSLRAFFSRPPPCLI